MAVKPIVLVACASSIATSTIVATRVREKLDEARLDVTVTQCSFAELDSKIDLLHPICALVTGKTKEYDIPVIVATPLLTGIGAQKIYDQVIQIIKDHNANN